MYKNYSKEVIEVLQNKKYMMLSDDLDSLVSCSLVGEVFGYKVNSFFNQHSIYRTNIISVKDTIGLDITFDNKYLPLDTISNHVERGYGSTKFSSSVSCNNHITLNDYGNKSLFSTSLFIWLSLKYPLPSTRKGLMTLMLIDESYSQYYNPSFKRHMVGYLKAYDAHELLELLENTTKEEFVELRNYYKMWRDITVDNNTNQLNIDNFMEDGKVDEIFKALEIEITELPKQFKARMKLKQKKASSHRYHSIRDNEKVISFAFINKSTVSYSIYDEIVV